MRRGEGGGHDNKANILFSVYYARAPQCLKDDTAMVPLLVKKILYLLAPLK